MSRILLFLNQVFLGPSDARPYAVVRIGFAVASLLNLLDIWPARAILLSDVGLFRRSEAFLQWNTFSVFYPFHAPGQVDALLIVAGIFMLSLAAGLFTRLSAFVVWAWSVSYSNGMYPALSASDSMFRAISFLLMISPTGKVWSLDSLRQRRKSPLACPLVPPYGLVLMRLQLTLVYFSTFLAKVPDPGWVSGDAVGFFLTSIYCREPLQVAANFPRVMVVLSYATLAVELALPWLLWNRRTRLFGFLLGFGLHGSILIVSRLWVFSTITMVSYLAFLDSDDIDCLLKRLRRIHSLVPNEDLTGSVVPLKEQHSHGTGPRTAEA